jgi:PilZ domain
VEIQHLRLKRDSAFRHHHVGEMAYTRERLYTRYPFSAAGEVVDGSGAGMPSAVTNISYGGCRLLTQKQLPLGAAITVRIQTVAEQFEATAKVVHSAPGEAGVMFGNIAAQSLFVLRKWIDAASEEKRRMEGQ